MCSLFSLHFSMQVYNPRHKFSCACLFHIMVVHLSGCFRFNEWSLEWTCAYLFRSYVPFQLIWWSVFLLWVGLFTGDQFKIASHFNILFLSFFSQWKCLFRKRNTLLQTAWPFILIDEVYTWQATAKFKCVVRVIAMYPLQAKDFRSPEGIYRVRLCLEDPTARIHALLYAEDGVRFL